jgi:hypothetical protein
MGEMLIYRGAVRYTSRGQPNPVSCVLDERMFTAGLDAGDYCVKRTVSTLVKLVSGANLIPVHVSA